MYKEQKAKERADEKEKQAAALASSAAAGTSTPGLEQIDLPGASPAQAAETTVSSAEALADPARADAIATAQQDVQVVEPTTGLSAAPRKPREKKEPAALRQAKVLAELEAGSDATGGRVENLEHTQLQREEAFFLIFCLDSLAVVRQAACQSGTSADSRLTLPEVWKLFTAPRISPSIASPASSLVRPDNAFIVSYVAYHHYRSLGWVVRNGIKFCSDWVLYKGSDGTQNMRGGAGPVGGHAE